MIFKLTLTTNDGVILRQFTIATDEDNEESDYIAPLRAYGASHLITQINGTIKEHAGPHEPRCPAYCVVCTQEAK